MAKHYNVTTVVAGGKQGTPQQYAGRVGGESTDFTTMDTEVKVTLISMSSCRFSLNEDGLSPDGRSQKQSSGTSGFVSELRDSRFEGRNNHYFHVS